MASVSAQRLAELVPCPVERVVRLAELGILEAQGDGRYASSDAHVVRLMGAFEAAGVSLDDVARGVATGELSFPLALFLPEPEETATTYESLADGLGRSPALLRRLHGEVGLPAPADDRIRAEDAEMLAAIVTTLDLADDDELSRFARLYGGTMQRLVTSGLQLFDQAVRQRAASLDLPNAERDRVVYEKGAAFAELVSAVVPWLQRRHREHAILEYLVGVLEEFMQERGVAPRQEREPPAIAFLDLSGYTALAEERGDEAAAELAAALAAVVQQAAGARECRPVKWLGDGVMFHFAGAGAAIGTGLDLVERTERAVSVPARMGINAGPVIVQDGDYFGRTVNVAARIADYARPHEVLVSDVAKRSADLADVDFELVGDVALRGVSAPVRLHRVTRRPPLRAAAGA